MKKTIFLDIDGCLFRHKGNLSTQITGTVELLPGAIEKLNEWEAEGHKIFLTTGRKESTRKITEEQLATSGIFYDQLIMGLNRGERIVINDSKNPPNDEISTAFAIQIPRNEGIGPIKFK
jgi:hydroxymethylpyrimidine pyrophosphatase-like HAD family hydrolase